mgnify:FL=1
MSATIDSERYKHVVEIGAGDSMCSQALMLLKGADRVTLYEPNTILCADLKRVAIGRKTVTVVESAVDGTSGTAPLIHLGYASYLLGAPSFVKLSIENDGEKWLSPLVKEVKLVRMGEIDSGDIDHLILTNNGCEMAVLCGMKSRPGVIQTKHYIHNEAQGKQSGLVCNWLHEHGYRAQVKAVNRYQTHYHLMWSFQSKE